MKYCILSYMTTTPPSRYEYRSDAEWETAMDEWCRDNEPQYTYHYKDADGCWNAEPVAGFDEIINRKGYGVNSFIGTRVAGRHHNGLGVYPSLHDRHEGPGESADGKYDHGASYRDGDHALLGIR